jgi:hypothetical protein
MRWVLAGLLSCLPAVACAASDRPDPSELARPHDPMRDAGSGIDAGPEACGEFCGETFLHEISDPPNLYFLLDRSGSMAFDMEGSNLTKYVTARKVLGSLLHVIGHRVRFGATVFPARDSEESCGPGVAVFEPKLGGLPACDGELDPTLVDFLVALGQFVPSGSTPTSAALAELRPRLEQLEGTTVLVLVTDGAPNCNLEATCGAEACSLNIEGSSVRGQACTPEFNCCDPDNTGELAGGYCVDTEATAEELERLLESGIPTYVVGMPGAELYSDVLERLAEAGGTVRSGDVAYYAVNDQAALEEALYQIGTGVAVRCAIDLESPPESPDLVNVYFDGELVPADPVDGWSWDGDTRILVHGDACGRLKSGDVIDARAVFGCDTIVR